jgi:hypothetical protein
MAKKVRIGSTRIARGQKMKRGKGWRLKAPGSNGKAFKATLIRRFLSVGVGPKYNLCN